VDGDGAEGSLVTVTVEVVTVDDSVVHAVIRSAAALASAAQTWRAGICPSNFTRRFCHAT
jgi:hypothetical protein